ncbi:MAG: DUF1501 domain-containing protein [Proteobacteria bacterium]|nr:DUF1501 domain-containing protein [Pseudomonadota bacterium]
MSPARRRWLQAACAGVAAASLGRVELALAAATPEPAGVGDFRNLIVLIELKGGNDGLNTLVPYADPTYYALRPKLAIARDQVVQLSDRAGLHPALAPLAPLWKERRLAVLQGVGYPAPNLSHFRSIEIWDTASASNQYLSEGWLTRGFDIAPPPKAFAADGVIIGSAEMGPLAGGGTRAVALSDTDQFVKRAKLARTESASGNAALEHILKVEGDIVQAAARLQGSHEFRTAFPKNGFGNAIRTASQVIANPAGVAAIRITLNGFDTHTGQLATQQRLFAELADGLVALRGALDEIDRWNSTLILTYAEFGRRPKENLSGGTDHGTANVHFALGGRVNGGFYGEAPNLDRLSGDGNPAHALDFRSVYATALDRWWGIDSTRALRGRFATVPFVTA